LSLQKEKTIEILRRAGVNVPPSVVVHVHMSFSKIVSMIEAAGLVYPLIVKPAWQNASVGIDDGSVVSNEDELFVRLEALHIFSKEPILLEQYIDGTEINAAFYGNPSVVLPLHKIDFSYFPKEKFPIVGYKAKWDKDSIEYKTTNTCLAHLPPEQEFKIRQLVEKTCEVLELRDYGRIDFRICQKGIPYVIDVNPNCDLSKQAGFSTAALSKGLSYENVIEEILSFALQRKRDAHTEHKSIGAAMESARSNQGSRATS